MTPGRRSIWFAWAAAGYLVLIYSTLGAMRNIQLAFQKTTGALSSSIINAAIIFCGGMLLWGRRGILRTQRRWMWALLVGAGYFAASRWLPVPEEKFHLVQYGILSFLVTQSLRGRSPSFRARHALSFLIVCFAGTVDEVIQHYLPARVGDFRDVVINIVSAGLAQSALLVLERDKGE